jgi:Ring finger domain
MIGVDGYPATGLRQRFDHTNRNNNNNGNVPVPSPVQPPAVEAQQLPQQQQQQQQPWRTSHVYCFVSAVVAVLAIVTSAASPSAANLALKSFHNNGNHKFLTEESIVLEASNHLATSTNNDPEILTTNPTPSAYMVDALDTEWWRHAMDFFFANNPAAGSPSSTTRSLLEGSTSDSSRMVASGKKEQQPQHVTQQQQPQPWWKLTWIGDHHQHKQQEAAATSKQQQLAQNQQEQARIPTTWWQNWLDASLLQAKPSTVTDLIDKVLTSTPRLLAIANLLLALTYQMHTAVADWFLGVGVYPPPGEWAMTGRERLGSFLVFKLLLISAVVTPDTLDLLILLSWYTLLSFLRSLAHLAAATTSHTTQSGQPPRAGVLQLLLVVLFCDIVACAACSALFQPAGVGMVVLLTCDCALLGVEVIGHILKHGRQVLEDMHEHTISEMEEQQLQVHARQRILEEQQQAAAGPDNSSQETGTGTNADASATSGPANQNSGSTLVAEEGWDGLDDLSLDGNSNNSDDDEDDGIRTLHRNNQQLLMEDSRRLDQAMDSLEVAHARRLAVLDTTIFVLQLLVHAITVGHFLHIWCLHGIQFTLIDGVLALHLHSALSAASKQIAERRNLHRIARNLDGTFENASELDLKMAHATGDVCCICLGAMSVGSVKKVGCGHLYHTSCLREVIERAHSIEAAKCPLCRASVVDGSHSGTNNGPGDQDPANGGGGGNNDVGNNPANVGNQNNGPRMGPNGLNHRGERALFRFSTEGILPTWMPLPAFSFEVVRRPTRQEQPASVGNASNNAMPQLGRMAQRNNANANINAGRNHNNTEDVEQSFLERLLVLAGVVRMSPEDEARALTQLVDMFPQYDRADLLRELRDRGSAEAVVESVLLGVFSGRVRGSAGGEAVPTRANNPTRQENEGDASAGNAPLPVENPTPSHGGEDINGANTIQGLVGNRI